MNKTAENQRYKNVLKGEATGFCKKVHSQTDRYLCKRHGESQKTMGRNLENAEIK
jgi:hypothetical protein